jgi:hypothetical protein
MCVVTTVLTVRGLTGPLITVVGIKFAQRLTLSTARTVKLFSVDNLSSVFQGRKRLSRAYDLNWQAAATTCVAAA